MGVLGVQDKNLGEKFHQTSRCYIATRKARCSRRPEPAGTVVANRLNGYCHSRGIVCQLTSHSPCFVVLINSKPPLFGLFRIGASKFFHCAEQSPIDHEEKHSHRGYPVCFSLSYQGLTSWVESLTVRLRRPDHQERQRRDSSIESALQ